MSSETTRDLKKIIRSFADQPILVVGDLMLDRFIWGRVERISPEAPVPVVEVLKESVHLGGAANVANNLRVLGARPLLLGVVGTDDAASRLIDELHKQGIDSEGVIQSSGRVTSVKTRIIAQHQQVCRADREMKDSLSRDVQQKVCDFYHSGVKRAQAVIISDYAKGVLSPPVIQEFISTAREETRFLSVDPKAGDFSVYRGATMITPNKKEAERAAGIAVLDESSFLSVGRKLLEITASDYLLITRGEEGMTLFDDERHTHIPALAREVFDVTGAGDTVIAALTLSIAAGASVWQAATIANHAARVVVGKLGTASVNVDELLRSLEAR